MSNEYVSSLKKKYIHQISPLKMVSEVIRELDLIPLKESELNVLESPHFRFLRENYRSAFNIDPSTIEFHFFLLPNNEKSKYYYDLMENKDERIIIVTETDVYFITSNCQLLSLDF